MNTKNEQNIIKTQAAALMEQLKHGFSDSEFKLLCLLKKIANASSSQPVTITAEQAIELLTCDNESIKAIVQELDLKDYLEGPIIYDSQPSYIFYSMYCELSEKSKQLIKAITNNKPHIDLLTTLSEGKKIIKEQCITLLDSEISELVNFAESHGRNLVATAIKKRPQQVTTPQTAEPIKLNRQFSKLDSLLARLPNNKALLIADDIESGATEIMICQNNRLASVKLTNLGNDGVMANFTNGALKFTDEKALLTELSQQFGVTFITHAEIAPILKDQQVAENINEPDQLKHKQQEQEQTVSTKKPSSTATKPLEQRVMNRQQGNKTGASSSYTPTMFYPTNGQNQTTKQPRAFYTQAYTQQAYMQQVYAQQVYMAQYGLMYYAPPTNSKTPYLDSNSSYDSGGPHQHQYYNY